ncbi:hypothetical protein ABT095_16080 [Kitasatospora sp. NPDC002227]|uniref:hypothetical protein n=1 Tax=Kitasatospora sp. NPDC002227 TaxID=3154773 RepID=UPI003320E0DB
MGVLTDYFRAADAASVVRELAREDGGPLVGGRRPVFDGVEAKHLDPCVVLGQLVAAVRGVPWAVDLVAERTVWPTGPEPGPGEVPDEDDPWSTGPWVSELGDDVRDVLAGVPDAELAAVAGRWVKAEELRPAEVGEMLPVAAGLVQLARRARTADERLYCWICL